MRLTRTTVGLAALLTVAWMAGCADYTTTGVPAGEDASDEAVTAGHGDPLDATSWQLAESTVISGDVAKLGITADFAAERLSGQAPVNSYFTDYTTSGTSIEFGEIGTTLMAGDPDLMTAEAAYLDALDSVDSFELTADALTLKSGADAVLGFAPARQAGSSTDPGGTIEAGQDINAFAGTLVGMSVADAEAATTEAGFDFRVVSVDGEERAVTMDYRPDRINVAVADDKVVRVTVG